MGIALPSWIVQAQNNIWVLAVYGLIVGGALPALVYNWWFGSRQKTKDGVFIDTAAAFFKAITEEAGMGDVVRALGQAHEWRRFEAKGASAADELTTLEGQVAGKLGDSWKGVRDTISESEQGRVRALVLLYAHLLRIPVQDASLQALQTRVLLNTPNLLNAYLNISATRGWLVPLLAAMRFQAYLAQAVLPGTTEAQAKLAQVPGLEDGLELDAEDIAEVAKALELKGDARTEEVKKVVSHWGRVEIVDASFKVLGERIVTPSALIHLVVKLRIVPPTSAESNGKAKEGGEVDTKAEEAFLANAKDVEEMPEGAEALGAAHAPHWPANRKPNWWIILADPRTNRSVIPPIRVSDVPFGVARAYKCKFNGPPGLGVFAWRVIVVSDTFIGEDVHQDLALKVEAVPENQPGDEDEISDPEEDTLAGQMAAMRGGKVKTRKEESDDESTTDDDGKDAESSSDSDSD